MGEIWEPHNWTMNQIWPKVIAGHRPVDDEGHQGIDENKQVERDAFQQSIRAKGIIEQPKANWRQNEGNKVVRSQPFQWNGKIW